MTDNRYTKLDATGTPTEVGAAEERTVAGAAVTDDLEPVLREELRQISPAVAQSFHRAPALSSHEWAEFKKQLQRELHVAQPSRSRTLKDRWLASDSKLTRIFAALIFLRR